MSHVTGNQVDEVINAAIDDAAHNVQSDERRASKRVPYDARVVLIPVDPDGEKLSPIVVRALDVSRNGLRLEVGTRLVEGMTGAIQLLRPNGQLALIGCVVRNYRATDAGEHEVGLEFTAMPPELPVDDFVDEAGQLRLLHPELRANLDHADDAPSES